MKKLLSAILIVVLVLSFSVIANAAPYVVQSGYCGLDGGENVRWILDSEGTLTITGTGKMESYNSLAERPWDEYREEIIALVIEEGITEIGDHAFFYLEKIRGDLIIPDSVEIIKPYAFEGCHYIDSITLGKSLKTIGPYAFADLEEIYGDLIIPDSVTYIGNHAFDGMALHGELIFGENLEVIGDSAFWAYKMPRRIVFPESIKVINNNAFVNSDIKEFYFKGDAPSVCPTEPYGVIASFMPDVTVYYPAGNETWETELGRWNGYLAKEWDASAIALGSCGTGLSWIISADGTLTISGTGEMDDYNKGYDAPWLRYCDSITSLVIEEGITRIGSGAFSDLTGLAGTTLSIPNSVEEIGTYAFRKCDFAGELILPENLVEVEMGAFEHAGDFTGTLVIPEGTETIGDYAFRDGNYTKVIIPKSVISIGQAPFAYNYVLEEIIVDEKNPYYSSDNGRLFTNEGELITFPAAVKGYYDIPEYVTSIRNAAFEGTSLDTIYIHENIKNIGSIVYSPQSDDITVVFEGTPESLGENVLPEMGKVIFEKGEPQSVIAAGEENASFGEDVELYYLQENEDLWSFDSRLKWNGYTVKKLPYDATINITSGTVAVGKNIRAAVSISENPGAKMIQFTVKYDAEILEIISCNAGEFGEESMQINYSKPGYVSFIWDDTEAISEETVLFDLEFKVKEGTDAKKTVIEIDKTKEFVVAKNTYTDFYVNAESGNIYIFEPLYGDANGDGTVNVKDTYTVRLIAAKITTVNDENMICADVNNDGEVNALDANIIRKYCVGIVDSLPVETE